MQILRFKLVCLLLVGLVTGCGVPLGMLTFDYQKPLSAPLSCAAQERVIVQVFLEEKPLVMGIEDTHWGEWFFDSLAYMPLGGVSGAVSKADNTSPQTDDYSAEFERDILKTLVGTDFQALLVTRLKQYLTPKTLCETVFFTWNADQSIPFQSSDKLIRVKAHTQYFGGRPVMKAHLFWLLITNMTNMPLIESNLAASYKIQQEIEVESQAQKPDRKKLDRLVKQSFELTQEAFSYYDAYDLMSYESQAYKRAEWLADDGNLLKQEINTAIDKLAQQLAEVMFSE